MNSAEKGKYLRIIEKNTFYIHDEEFEGPYEGYLSSIKTTLLVLKNTIEDKGLRKEIFVDLIQNKPQGLRALLALTGISNESLKRLITLTRIINNKELNKLTLRDKWFEDAEKPGDEIREWSDETIEKLIKTNPNFAKGIVNIFFEGAALPILLQSLPLFELKKLSLEKLQFKTEALLDTLIRYKEKGSYSGLAPNNPVIILQKTIKALKIDFTSGDLPKLAKFLKKEKRTMDCIIPNKENPLIIVESSYLMTTSSGQGDKAKTEINIAKEIKKHYPNAMFIGFIDGIGWYVRKNDLKRMVAAYDDVFTFHPDEISRFKDLLIKVFSIKR